MEVTQIENLPPPPGIVNSIKAGFDAVASHIRAILLPFLLNLFLWLGPRLRMDSLFKGMEGDLAATWAAFKIPADEIQLMLANYQTALQSFNLFWFLRTQPIGVSSLFAIGQGGGPTPLGSPEVWQVNALTLPLWVMGMMFIGWLGGALYFRAVAGAALAEKIAAPRAWMAILQTFLISILCNVLLFTVGFPAMFILLAANFIVPGLANVVVLLASLASVWVIVPLYFWSHGVFLNRQNALTAMLSSLQLTRFTLPTSSLFVMAVFILSYGLGYLWRIPKPDSWLTLAGIFGHSFVTTALLAGSFIYYYDMSAWLRATLERLRPGNIVKQA